LWSMWHAELFGLVRLVHVQRRRRVHARSDASVRELRYADLHLVVHMGNVFGRGAVCSARDACGQLRSVFAAGVQLVVPVGNRVHATIGERV
jgi:hypothetical protein